MYLKKIAVLGLVAAAFPAMAQDDEEKGPWSGESELGYSYESGNTNETNLNFRQKVVYDAHPWTNTLNFRASNSTTRVKMADGTTEDQRTAEAYLVTEKLDYYVSEKTYSFFRATWEKDRFSGFEHQASQVVGFGHQVFGEDTLSLKFELGAGARQDELDEDTFLEDGTTLSPEAGETTREAIVFLSDDFSWKFAKGSELGQSLAVEYGDENSVSRFETYVKSQLVASLSLKVSYQVKYTEKVPADTEKRDEKVLASLLYSFWCLPLQAKPCRGYTPTLFLRDAHKTS